MTNCHKILVLAVYQIMGKEAALYNYPRAVNKVFKEIL